MVDGNTPMKVFEERDMVAEEENEQDDWLPLTPSGSLDTTTHSEDRDMEDVHDKDDTKPWLSNLALFGDSQLALLSSTLLLMVAVAVSWYVDHGHLSTFSREERAYRALGPVPNLEPPVIFETPPQQESLLLSDEMRRAYTRDGVVAFRGLLSEHDLYALDQATQALVREQHDKNTAHKAQKPKVLSGRKPTGNQFHTVRQHAMFLHVENTTTTSPFVQVAMKSLVPEIAAKLLLLLQSSTEETCANDESQTVRILRDIVLAKDEEEYVCGWHVDDIGFWPALADAPGVNAWIALDDMPVELGGGFALAVGSHHSEWRQEAYELTGSTHFFPPHGFTSSHDILQNRPGNGTCNIQDTAPHLHRRMEETKRVYNVKRGDVIFHDRWLFHRTIPFDRKVVSERDGKDETPLLYRRYSIRYGPGSSVIPPGYGTEPSVISDPTNGGRTADAVAENDAAWYPKVWPIVDERELESMKTLAAGRLPEATEKSEQRKRLIRPRRKNQH
jgi:ectoine hydroxylase-related dioxygenase (phytanoyl-CoA dioxygenase family)